MSLRIKRTYTCNQCGKEDSNVSSELMLPKWFHVQLTSAVLYGGTMRDIPLRATNSVKSIGDYCSLPCVHAAMQQAVETILGSLRDETNKINSQEFEASRNNVSEGA